MGKYQAPKAQRHKEKCNSSPQRARRTQSNNPLNPPLLRGTPETIPLSKGGLMGLLCDLCVLNGELNCNHLLFRL